MVIGKKKGFKRKQCLLVYVLKFVSKCKTTIFYKKNHDKKILQYLMSRQVNKRLKNTFNKTKKCT